MNPLLVIPIFTAGLLAGWYLQQKQRTERNLVTALESLTASINTQTTATSDLARAVDDAVAHINTPGATDQQLAALQTVVDSNTATVAANTARLVAAVNPTPPTP